jgi:hypothetical protein
VYLTAEAFLESKTLRDRQLANLNDDRAEEVLNKARALIFHAWQGAGIASNEQVATFYEVSTDVLKDNIRRHRAEFESDGLKALRGKALRDASEIISLASKTSQATIWTPRAALRLGMVLRDSAVAKQVRNLLLEMVAQGASQSPTERELALQVELQRLKQHYQDTGWQIVQATSPAMLAFIRGEAPLVRTEVQYVDSRTGEPLGTTSYRILPQLVEDLGLKRNSETDQQLVKEILSAECGINWETGQGLSQGFNVIKPLVIPEDQYEEYLYVVAKAIYGEKTLEGWQQQQQMLPEFLQERGILPPREG